MKIIRYYIPTFILFVLVAFSQGCSDDTNPLAPSGPNVSGLTLQGEAYAIGGRAKVLMYSDGSLKTGYNKIYLVLYDSVTNNLINDAHIEFSPANHGVTAPVENPPSLAVDGIFEGAVVFMDPQTPADDPRHWHFHIHVHNHEAPGEPDGEAEFSGFTVLDTPDRILKFQPDTTTTYLFSLVHPSNPSIGVHDFEFVASKLVGSAYEEFNTCLFDSIAVSMSGNLSDNNVLPVFTQKGHYKGKVNLSSAGQWNVFMKFRNHTDSPRHSFSADFFKITAQ